MGHELNDVDISCSKHYTEKMAGINLTLQNRIITLVVICSILLISAVTVVQLNNRLEVSTDFNTYRANLSGNIAKASLENTIRLAPSEAVVKTLQANLKGLNESNIISDAVIFDKNGTVVAATNQSKVGSEVRAKDLIRWEELNALKEESSIVSDINTLARKIDIFIGLKKSAAESLLYTAKISFSLDDIQTVFSRIYGSMLFVSLLIILANILLGYLLSKTVLGPIKVLNEVTKIISQGNLSVRTKIHTHDELEELGKTFNHMTEELIKMKERAENANPLTKLPGNIVIHEEVDKQIKRNRKFVVIYCDLDNFKAFNDKYGIAKGDDAIKLTADIFRESVKQAGNADDFVGHEGGDDFILLTTPNKAQAVADYITSTFDKRVRALYTKEDLDQGHIIAHARDGSIKEFPIMTISLAGVTNEQRDILSYGEVTNIAAEVKKKAKAVEGSVFVMDKRRA
ncbi:MAG TPA: diguanylate cyclase [Candidatus Omnitrophota bacterium]|nr:diguanylate cyclase [Candidatus Omnitrophota bacterium]